MSAQTGIMLAVLGYVISVTLLTGVILKRKKKQEEEGFMLANRSLPYPVVGVTMALTVLGAVHVFGLFEMGFSMGAVSIWFVFAHIIFLVIAGFATGPWVRRLKFTTMPEFLGELYGEKMRVLVMCVSVGVIWGFLTLEAQGLGILFSLFTGWELKQAIILGSVLGLLYVIVAGMEQVGWLNLVNTVVIYVGLVIGIIYLTLELPGGNWESVNNFYINNGQDWKLSIWGTPDILYGFGLAMVCAIVFSQSVNQTLLQSAISAKDVKTVRKATWIAAPANGLFGVFTIAMGLAAAANPEFAALGPKMAGPVMLTQLLPSWLIALLLAGFLSAVLSTFAMHSLTTATMFVKDIYVNVYNPDASEKQQMFLTRLFIIILAVLATVVGTFLPTIVAAVAWLSSFLAPVFFFLIYGLFWRRSEKAALITIGIAWTVNILWSFSPLPQWVGLPGDINAYLTLGITIVIGTPLFAIMKDAKPAYFKEKKMADAQKKVDGAEEQEADAAAA
jgi:solute:Na+ symporter, SSS family